MLVSTSIDPIDYLIIGHLTCDTQPIGCQLGGTAAYAALTARNLGLRPGIVTSYGPEISLEPLEGIPVVNLASDRSTTFENIHTETGRQQTILAVAENLGYHNIPESWRSTPIIHLAPIAKEIDSSIVRSLTNPLLGITPQGWLREWDQAGKVHHAEWPEAVFVMRHAGAVVISVADVGYDESIIEEFASACPVLAVTESDEGSRIYWNGDVRRFKPPQVAEIDTVGSGDIFAAAFFVRLYTTRDPWEAARFATQLAAFSVTRQGMNSIPTIDEIESCLVEVM